MGRNGCATRWRAGFTIVELLVVIVVIAILATITIVSYKGIQNKARAAAGKSDIANLNIKLQYYFADNQTLPTSLASMSGFGGVVTNGIQCANNCLSDSTNVPQGKYGVSFSGGDAVIVFWWSGVGWVQFQWFIDSNGSLQTVGVPPQSYQYLGTEPDTGTACMTQNLNDCYQ